MTHESEVKKEPFIEFVLREICRDSNPKDVNVVKHLSEMFDSERASSFSERFHYIDRIAQKGPVDLSGLSDYEENTGN